MVCQDVELIGGAMVSFPVRCIVYLSMRLRCLLVALSLAAFQALVLYADGPEGVIASEEPDCPGPPPGAQPLEYTILFTQTRRSAEASAVVPLGGREPVIAVRDGQEIRDEALFVRVFGKPSEGIDWTAFRILVVQETTTYKRQELESVIVLSGIYGDADGIYVGLEMTQYGPCQGIAQLSEWFSYDRTDLFVLLPAQPAGIAYYSCVIGGCPPGIP